MLTPSCSGPKTVSNSPVLNKSATDLPLTVSSQSPRSNPASAAGPPGKVCVIRSSVALGRRYEKPKPMYWLSE